MYTLSIFTFLYLYLQLHKFIMIITGTGNKLGGMYKNNLFRNVQILLQ